jgi:uncharacterized membrane protein
LHFATKFLYGNFAPSELRTGGAFLWGLLMTVFLIIVSVLFLFMFIAIYGAISRTATELKNINMSLFVILGRVFAEEKKNEKSRKNP